MGSRWQVGSWGVASRSTARMRLTALQMDPDDLSHEGLAETFAQRTAMQWQQWADERDIPLAAVVTT